MRDMLVFDWLFGYRRKETLFERNRRENPYVSDSCYGYRSYRHYGRYDAADYISSDFDDDLDSGTFDDDL